MNQTIPRITQFAAAAVISAFTLWAGTVHAQIGTGWTQFNPSSNIQIETHEVIDEYSGSSTSLSDGDGRFTSSSGVETFQLLGHNSNRVERRYHDEYSSGTQQFEADVMLSTPSHNESIHQIFNGTTGPWLIVRELSNYNGCIRMGGGTSSGILASNLYGRWFRLNSINDMNTGNTYIYVDGVLKWTGQNPGGTFYTKYGCYGTLGAASATIQFKNIKRFSGGSTNQAAFSGWYKIVDRNSGKVPAVQGAQITNGAPVILWTFGSAQNDQWQLTPTDSGYYQVVNRHSGKVMAVQSASTSSGAKVIQWSFGSAQNDQWKPVSVGSGYYKLVNRHSGLVLDVSGAATVNGTPFVQWTDNGAVNQQFQFVSEP
jgi:hypothetical protein